jgi:type IV secretion system protein VirB11
LRQTLGTLACQALDDASVVEIMLNPNGSLYVERLGQGIDLLGRLEAGAAETIIGIVAHALQTEVNSDRPIISGVLPIGGHRFEGLLPPVVAAPSFTIRRRASQLISLDEYEAARTMSAGQAAAIRQAVRARKNIVVCGGTGSGKTTLANALIAEIVATAPHDRIVILEETAEIRCAADNSVVLQSNEDIDIARLLKSTMRLRPDRIVVGEIRDGAALTLLKAWNTGHPGGVTTVHSNSAMSALRRLEQLTAEVSQQSMQAVIGDAVDLIVSIERAGGSRRVRDVLQLNGFDGHQYQIVSCPIIEEELHAA